MFAMAVTSMVAAALMGGIVYSLKSLRGVKNYVYLGRDSRRALDQMMMDVRGCKELTSATPSGSWTNVTAMTLKNDDADIFTYAFTSTNTFIRTFNGSTATLVTNCTGHFDLFQPKLQASSWNLYDAPSSLTSVGIILVKWRSTARDGSATNSEDIVTAKIYMRNCKK